MTISLTRFALALALTAGAQATTINFTTTAPSGSCFTNTYNDASSGCQANGVSGPITFTNAQGDSASLQWVGFTNSIGFGGGPVQNVNYGRFTLTYTSNAGDTTPVTIPQISFLMIIKEISPSVTFYPAILADLANASNGAGLVGPSTTDLQATFSPTTVSNNVDTTFFVSPATQTLNGPGISSGQSIVTGQIQDFATPEPSTWLLLGAAVPFVLRHKRRYAGK